MKKNIGNVLALYPTPAMVVGTEVNGKVNWLLVAHAGIIGHDLIMLSMFKKHYTNEGVKQTGKVSVNMVNEAMLDRADYVGWPVEQRRTSRMYSCTTWAKPECPSSTRLPLPVSPSAGCWRKSRG